MSTTHAVTYLAPSLVALGLVLGGSAATAQQRPAPGDAQQRAAHGEAVIYTTDDLEWRDGPATLPPGAQLMVLEGDPASEGYFAVRFRLPDEYEIPPHWHPVHERVTVISGTFHLGHGAEFDEEDLRALPAGSFFSMPPQMRHFARAEGETIIQLNSIGPWEIHYVNPDDDPRRHRN